MDLILHIGHAKTGTTTLQSHFADLPGYLGRPELFGKKRRAAGLDEQFLSWCQGHEVDLVAWRSTVLDAFEGEPPARIIVSQERLVNWFEDGMGVSPIVGLLSEWRRVGRSGPHPIAAFIRDHVAPAWEPLGGVRVLLTLRNQFDWLASHYAQESHRVIGASQWDFERQVRRIIRTRDEFLDYAGLIDALHDAIGPDRVTTLLLEDMGTEGYWATLSALVGERLPKSGREAQHSNQRSSEEGWQLRDYLRGQYPLKYTLAGRVATRRRPSVWSLAGLVHPAHVARVLVQQREASIRQNERLRAAVRAGHREGNRRLGHLLGRDLTPLGY